jgi:hypothetical protein
MLETLPIPITKRATRRIAAIILLTSKESILIIYKRTYNIIISKLLIFYCTILPLFII